jgi:hypothetical protein
MTPSRRRSRGVALLPMTALVVWCACLLVSTVGVVAMDSDLYFYVQEQMPRCFSEDLPGDTTVVGSYKHPDQGVKKLRVIMLDPQGDKIFESNLEEAGRFAYHVASAGEHRICIEATGEGDGPWPVNSKTAKFHLKIEIQGKDATSAISDDVVRKDHITDLTAEIVHLERLIDLILADLQYLKVRVIVG